MQQRGLRSVVYLRVVGIECRGLNRRLSNATKKTKLTAEDSNEHTKRSGTEGGGHRALQIAVIPVDTLKLPSMGAQPSHGKLTQQLGLGLLFYEDQHLSRGMQLSAVVTLSPLNS